MAMNFKVFEDKQHAADYAGDIRKQFNNNQLPLLVSI